MATKRTIGPEHARIGPTSTGEVLRAVLTLLDWQQQIVQDALRQLDGSDKPSGHRPKRRSSPRGGPG